MLLFSSWYTSKLTIIIANTSKRTNEMSNARSLVVNPTASTESEILAVTSLAVTRMPQRNMNSIFVNSQDANSPKHSQEKTIIRDTCDSVITLPSNHLQEFAELAILYYHGTRMVRNYTNPYDKIIGDSLTLKQVC